MAGGNISSGKIDCCLRPNKPIGVTVFDQFVGIFLRDHGRLERLTPGGRGE